MDADYDWFDSDYFDIEDDEIEPEYKNQQEETFSESLEWEISQFDEFLFENKSNISEEDISTFKWYINKWTDVYLGGKK